MTVKLDSCWRWTVDRRAFAWKFCCDLNFDLLSSKCNHLILVSNYTLVFLIIFGITVILTF